MFDNQDVGVGLSPGEGTEDEVLLQAEDDLAYEIARRMMGDGWSDDDQHFLPDDLEEIAPGPYLAAIVSGVDAERLNGHDVVRLMQAQARLGSHHEAGKLAAVAEVAFSPPGGPGSGVERSPDEVEYSSVEIAAGLTLTRRGSDA